MSKIFYLLGLLIIHTRAFDLRIINLSLDNWLLFQLFYLIVGFLFFGSNTKFNWFSKELKCWWIWVLGVFLSMLPAFYIYSQTFSQSFVAYRRFLLLLQIPVLFKISPTKDEVVKALMLYFCFLWLVYFMQSVNPQIVNVDDETLEDIYENGSETIVVGWFFPAILLFYFLEKIIEQFKYSYLLIIFLCILFIFLEQNRSLLFSSTAIIGWSILKIKSKRFIVIPLLLILAIIVIDYTSNIWINLFEETTQQLGNNEYNRNKAIQYFLFSASPNIWCSIFGNGFLSAHATTHMQDMMNLGVYNSDVGFIGYWNQFGILPIVVFMLLLLPAAIGKHNSHFIRCWAIQILICFVTISYWGGIFILYFSLFYYLYYVDLVDYGKTSDLINNNLL